MKTMPSLEFRQSLKGGRPIPADELRQSLSHQEVEYGSFLPKSSTFHETELRPCSELQKRRYQRDLILLACAALIIVYVSGFPPRIKNAGIFKKTSSIIPEGTTYAATTAELKNEIPACGDEPCFHPDRVQVRRDRPYFPSFWNYNGNLSVSYDERAIRINDKRVLLLSGSMHPVRATRGTWEHALDEAVYNGLNMITVYIFWGAHQSFRDEPLNWSLDGSSMGPKESQWELADALRSAANRGLFIHVRIGPYACGEYTYGGIPEWLPLQSSTMRMRRLNRPWLDAMEGFVAATITYLSSFNLWAHQGGPILIAQIENELGSGVDGSAAANYVVLERDEFNDDKHEDSHLLQLDRYGHILENASSRGMDSELRNATVQDYADWCGNLVARLAPNVIWTMCNGLSAENTISTFNGNNGIDWLEKYGDSGRIQVDQPAIWTEDEGTLIFATIRHLYSCRSHNYRYQFSNIFSPISGGFQLWGDQPSKPSDYFWGRTSRAMATDALQWFARGGTHLNYYMWWGGYNRGRSSAAGIMNAYATDAFLCSSGQRRHPKYDHFLALHLVIADIAAILLHAPTSLLKNASVEIMDGDDWIVGDNQRQFLYQVLDTHDSKQVIFLENDANTTEMARLTGAKADDSLVFVMKPYSSQIVIDGIVAFDSSTISTKAMSFRRTLHYEPAVLLHLTSWSEPIAGADTDQNAHVSTEPLEQTNLNSKASISSDYAWYGTDVKIDVVLSQVKLYIGTEKATALAVFIDGAFIGEANNHQHAEGPTVLSIEIESLAAGTHRLAILCESLGYHNLIGRWGAITTAKPKGITGNVLIGSPLLSENISLVDGRQMWWSLPGLSVERKAARHGLRRESFEDAAQAEAGLHPLWSSVLFTSPQFDSTVHSLFLDLTSGRGHLWLNGKDLGRYWNITRGNSWNDYSQRYYFLPADFLHLDGQLNELILFDMLGGDHSAARLLLSSIEESETSKFSDEVDFALACI
jgi:hypothetical protein